MSRAVFFAVPLALLVAAYLLSDDPYGKHADTGTSHSICLKYESMGLYDKAEMFCREALEQNPQDTDVMTSLGTVLQLKGEYDKAMDLYEFALRIDPENTTALRSLIFAYNRQVRFSESRPSLNLSVKLPTSVEKKGKYDKHREVTNFINLYSQPLDSNPYRYPWK